MAGYSAITLPSKAKPTNKKPKSKKGGNKAAAAFRRGLGGY